MWITAVPHCAAFGAALALSITTSAGAQDFNPYEAFQAGGTLDELVPVIEDEIGIISDRSYVGETVFEQPTSGPVIALLVQQPHAGGRHPAYFFFCEEVLMAFASPVTQTVAFAIAEDIGAAAAVEDQEPPAATARLADSAVTVELADGETMLNYYDIGTADHRIEAVHPSELFRTLDFYGACVGEED